MTHPALSFRWLPVLVLGLVSFGSAACGGNTIGVDPDGTPPAAEDAGTDAPPSRGKLPAISPSPSSGVDASSGVACTTSSDCSDGQECAWPVTEDACNELNAVGSCVTPLELACNAIERVVGCGCNGQNVLWSTGCIGLPSGWAPVGLAHAGACEMPLPPVTVDAGGPTPVVSQCKSGSDCAAGQVCLNSDPLQVPFGTCVPNPCGSQSLTCGCAASLCTGIGPCDISSDGTVACLSEG